MTIKTIIAPFQGHEDEIGALLTAFELAIKWKAHVEVWHVSPDPYDVMMPFMAYSLGSVYPEATINELKAVNAKRCEQIENIFTSATLKSGICDAKGASASLHCAQGRIDEIIGFQSRLADIVVVSRSINDGDDSLTGILNQIIFHSGRPLILIPPSKERFDVQGNTIIAWDGSAEAARAISYSFPFMRSDQTFILSVLTDDGKNIPLPQRELEVYLQRHNIRSKLIEYDAKKSDLPECLLASAKAHSATLLVMGAYSRTRLQEVIFGGATRFMIDRADIPVLLSH